MSSRQAFSLGEQFPHEGFVQRALEQHFSTLGYDVIDGGNTDLVCVHPQTQQNWVVEAKGRTSAIGLDFRTGLGQLLSNMGSQTAHYALAIPDLPQFLNQCRKVDSWVRQALRLHWLVVSEDGTVRTVRPTETP